MAASINQSPQDADKTQMEINESAPSNNWSKPPKIDINLKDFIEKAKNCMHLVTDKGVTIDLPRLQEIQKRCLTIFIVDRKTKNVIRGSPEIINSLLATTGHRPIRLVKCNGYNT